jgi:RNA polymerase sigma-70 factor (ECF subfamily)
LGTEDESRDACQEAAARALAAGDRYDPSQPFYPWFYRILKNHCFDRLKGRKRMAPTDKEPSPPERDSDAGAEGVLVASERARAVSEAIAALPDDLREIIELRHFQDLSYDEMAAILDCPVGTVMSRLYRARKRLREGLLAHPGFDAASRSKEARS